MGTGATGTGRRHDVSAGAARAIVEVLEIVSPSEPPDAILDFSLDQPTAGTERDNYALHLNGWVLGRHSPVTGVEVYYKDKLIRTMQLDYPRPGLADSHPGFADENAKGFNELVGVVGFSPEFRLNLRAVVEGEAASVPFATIRARHEPIRTSFDPRLQPIMLTSLPRTGTTRIMRMLAVHPGIVVFRRFPYEHNNAEYWAHTRKVLVEPANTVESSGRELHTDFWWVGNNPFYDRHIDEQPEYSRWFARTYTERLASFCQQSIDDWYTTVARRHHQDGAVYFAEKHRPGQIPTLLWELYPRAKEICLVRDPRDMICSVMKFFGKDEGARSRAQSDEQFIHWMGGSVLELYDDWVARSDRAHLLRYEDSVLAPAETLTSLLDYLGLDSSPAIVQKMLNAADEGTPAHFPQHQTSGSPEASIGRWRRDLNESLQAACEQAFSRVLSGFDYQP